MSTPHLMPTYARLPVSFVKGEGAWLTDTDGKRYLDALSGIAVCGLGHAHPAVQKAVCEQAGTLIHTSNLYGIPLQDALADQLCALSGMERVFFCNSGAEANEAAIKLARLYGHQRGVSQPTIAVMEKSFHGRTLATLTATGNRKVQAGFEPLVPGFVRVPYNDVAALENLSSNKDIVAVLVEPIQGEGGIQIPPVDYLQQVRALCDQNQWLLMVDEVQAGIGRTGTWFGFQASGIQPDVVSLAKGLGNGVPVGACLAGGAATEVFGPGNHGSTFGGNPLAMAAAKATLDTVAQENLAARATALGERIVQGLQNALADCDQVSEIRGRGLMIGIELKAPCGALVRQALDAGLLINVTADRVVRLLPPLILSDAEADEIVTRLAPLIRAFTPDV
jgi:acetylornithine/N-succinyldiaminopimelate aminotransferase